MTQEEIKNFFKKYDTPLSGNILNKKMLEIKEHKCECCGNTEWLGQPIHLQVHHIDGDRTNNTLENLQLLCLNCHSYTPNYGSKNNQHIKNTSEEDILAAIKNNDSIRQALLSLELRDTGANYKRVYEIMEKNNIHKNDEDILYHRPKLGVCQNCGKPIYKGGKYCSECYHLSLRKVERPDRETLKQLAREKPFAQIARQYGVNPNNIPKWLRSENLPSTKKEINSISDEDWLLI